MARIGLIGENSVEYVNHLLDIWNNGDCAVLIDWRIPIATALEMMKEAGVRVCYIETGKYDIPINSNKTNFIVYERKSNSAKPLPVGIHCKYKENYSCDEAVILYSSGTTGKEKGIILSHYAISTNVDAIIDYMQPSAIDCIYVAKALSHSSALTGELMVALKAKMKLIIAPTVVPPRFILQNIDEFGVSIMCLNPTLLQMLVREYKTGKYTMQSLKTIYVSGSILNDKLYKEAHSVLKNIAIYNVYGLSEAGPRVTAQHIGCCKSNSAGKPIKGVEIGIVDDEGNLVKRGERGIIHVNTPSRFDGYITGNGKNKSLYKDWLNTGDVGFIDRNDELHIVERIDDVIIIDSHKIYPSEVENAILANSSIECCVVSTIELSHKEYICCAYSGKKENVILLKQKLLRILISYEIPRYWVNCDSIPSTINGKYMKNEMQKLFARSILKEMSVI